MGQAPNVKPADRIRPSGVSEEATLENQEGKVRGAPLSTEALPDALPVPLYQLRPAALQETEVGHPVTVRVEGEELSVSAPVGRIGDVSPTFRSEVKERGLWGGVVRTLNPSPPEVVVLLYREVNV